MAVPFQSGRGDGMDEYECYRQSPIQSSPKESHKSSTFVLPSHASSSTSSSASSPFSPYPPPPPPQASSIDIPRNTHNNRKTGNPPRPPNAWICYRSARVHELKNTAQYSKMPQASISKLIGELWRSESPEVRKQYELEAAAKKLEHREKYPDYSFRPVRRESTKKAALKKGKSLKKSPVPSGLPSVLQPAPIVTSHESDELPIPPPSVSASSSSSCAPSPVDSDYPDSRFQYPSSTHSTSSVSQTFEPYHPELPSPPAQESLQSWTMFQPVVTYPPDQSYEGLPTPSIDYYDPPPYPPSNNYHYLPPSYEAAPPDQTSNNQPQFQPFLPSFTPTPYLSPPISEGPSSSLDDAWRMASASAGDFVDVPYHYSHPSYPP
ncbi:hypothetical protein JCM5353_004707 [Sporobolomyces roseus]